MPETFSISQAKQLFETRAGDLRIPNSDPEYHTKSTTINIDEIIVPQWKKALFSENEYVYRYEVPLKQSRSIGALISNKVNDTPISANIVSTLVIEKSKISDRERYFIASVIGVFSDNRSYTHPSYTYTGDRSEFTGFLVLSDEYGKITSSYQYDNGKVKRVKLGKSAKEQICTDEDCKHDHGHAQNFAYRLITFKPSTKGGGDSGGGDVYSYCYYCHSHRYFIDGVCSTCGNFEEIDEAIITVCSECGSSECDGFCDEDPDPDFPCAFCGSPNCSGECLNGGGNNGSGNPGGGNNGGGQTPTYAKPINILNYARASVGIPIPTMCASYGMSYLGYIYGLGMTAFDILQMYNNLNKESAWDIQLNNFKTFLDLLFTNNEIAVNFLSVKSSIDRGYPLIGYYFVEYDPIEDINEYHLVVIIGYTEDAKYMIWDPKDGFIYTYEPYAFEKLYEITGNNK